VSSAEVAAELIDSVERCREVVELLATDQPLALDLEGSLWGRKIDVCLLQIASKSGRCFLFDITQGGAALFLDGGLRRLLEDVHVLKVGHDLRSDASALYGQFNVLLNHVFDTQGATLSLM
jgi:ribonuclease D